MSEIDPDLFKKYMGPITSDLEHKYAYWIEFGIKKERERIREWILANRREIDLGDDVVIYRDSFDSRDILAFLDEEPGV